MISQIEDDINGLVQDCSNSSALAMELLQSSSKPLIFKLVLEMQWDLMIYLDSHFEWCHLVHEIKESWET